MSNIAVILIQNREMLVLIKHYREAINLIKKNVSIKNNFFSQSIHENNFPASPFFVDSGYILIDTENRVILSSQDCFNIHEYIGKEIKRDWNVFDLRII